MYIWMYICAPRTHRILMFANDLIYIYIYRLYSIVVFVPMFHVNKSAAPGFAVSLIKLSHTVRYVAVQVVGFFLVMFAAVHLTNMHIHLFMV